MLAVRDGEPNRPAVPRGQGQPDLDHLLEWFRVRQGSGILGPEAELGRQLQDGSNSGD